MGIRHRLSLGFLSIAVLVAILGYVFIIQLDIITQPLKEDIPESIELTTEAAYLNSLAQFIRYYDELLTQSARNYAFTQDKKWKQRYQETVPELDAVIKEAVEKGDQAEKEIFSSIDQANIALVEMESQAIEYVDRGSIKEAVKILESDKYWREKNIYEEGLKNYVQRMGSEYNQALSASTLGLDQATEKYIDSINNARGLITVFIVIALLLAILMGIFISGGITRSINKLRKGIKHIGDGDLNYRLQIGTNDEIQDLADSFNRMTGDLKNSTASVGMLNKEIAERKRVEEKYRTLYESSNDAIMILEPPDWRFTAGNPAAIKLFSAKDEKEFIATAPWELSPEKQPDGVLSASKAKKMIEMAMEKGSNFFEWTHKGIKGAEFPATVLLTRMKIADRTFLQATVRDISSQKIAEERIERANQEWDDTFNSISDMVFILDNEHTITKANKAFLDTMKKKREDVENKKCFSLVHGKNVPWPNCPHQKTIGDNKAHTEKITDPSLGASLLVSTSPIFAEDGKVMGSVHIAKDISEIVRSENELKKVKEKLEVEARGLKEANEGILILNKQLEEKNKELGKLDQLKSDFVSVVSHELRTPLSITKEGVSLVLDEIPGKVNDKQKNILNTSRDNIDRLAAIINDLLDISKIESGKVELKKSLVDISGLVREVCKEWASQAGKKEQELFFSLPKGTVNIYIDRNKIIQVMNNLVSNAIKYTPERGRIKIELKDEKKEIKLSVSDSGIGIAKEDLPKAFGKFQQFGRTAGAGPKGTGLGLAICKQIVEMHQGKIEIESQIDKGTKLIFCLPKMESEKVFKEYINSGIRETVDKNNSMSLVVITLKDFSGLQKKLGQEKAHELLKCFEKAIEGCLRRKADTVVRDSGELVVLLLDTNKESVNMVKQRIEEAIKICVSEGTEAWYNDLKITIGGATYPDEATNDVELLKKSRRQK